MTGRHWNPGLVGLLLAAALPARSQGLGGMASEVRDGPRLVQAGPPRRVPDQ
jgi:hypothetical protein